MTDVAAVLDQLGIQYQVRGTEASALCPAHADRHPSWSVNLESGMHHCFSCGFGGGLHALVRHVTGKGVGDAAMWVKRQRVRTGSGWRAPEPVRPVDNSWRYTEAALHFFADPPAEQLSARRLTAQSCEQYRIKWDEEKSSWIIPIRDNKTGELKGWQEKDGRLFRNRPRTVAKSEALFGLRSLEHGCRPILVESPLDAARLYSAGIPGGVSSYGVSASTAQLSPLINRTGQIVLALDNDAAGIRETRRIARRLYDRVTMFNYGKSPAKDVGEMSDEEILWGMANLLTRNQWLKQHPA